jgi:predicted AlkP superfamily phosphohydrolase/phosphomutase
MLFPAMKRSRYRLTRPFVGLRSLVGVAFVLFFARSLPAQQQPPLLVMISVDGLRPDYVTAAEAHGAKIPNLRRFLREGTYAEGTQGVVPTVTYPSHTTRVTGVWPAKHGILANTTFDPSTHGGLPDLPDLRASFFLIGPGVPAGRSLGVVDMRDVAPTLAHLMGLSLPGADGKNLLQ